LLSVNMKFSATGDSTRKQRLHGAAAELYVRGQRNRAFQHACVHECLRQVAAQLPLVHVELLGVQRGGPAGAPVALEPVRAILAV
jgi:hypothetical protein